MEEFITIIKPIEVEITEKKSKFIATLFPIETQEEAEQTIKDIKRKYYNARHNCIAYRVIDKETSQMLEKASDDGEPSGTAGAPMLNILQKNNLGNILVVVTRYFGGILLGTGGLVRAYSDATLKGIEEAEKIEKIKGLTAETKMDYQDFESFKYYCKKNEIAILKTDYNENIVCKIAFEEIKKEKLVEDFETKKIILQQIRMLESQYINKSILK